MSILQYLKKFEKAKIAVIGDLMLDKYIFGDVRRISPEAPVPIITVKQENFVPGGAANAANNVASLTGNSFLFGFVGNDIAKNILLDECNKRNIDTSGVIVNGKPTIQKIRVLGQNQQLLRIDYEEVNNVTNGEHKDLSHELKKLDNLDILLISDYAKGTIEKKFMTNIMEYAKKNNIKIVIDPKPRHKNMYTGCYLITPNKKEAEEMVGFPIETDKDLEIAGQKLIRELNCNVLITMGEKGMSLFEKTGEIIHIPTVAQEVYDVSGAGDTVIATLSLAISSGASLKQGAILANHAAGIKVGKLGTAPVLLEELENSLDEN